ncbi:hypothetical protein JOD54_005849 [Actinokineospora baliensis]|uniref:DUF7933 domain-containing protein n=1 Tax=Actinokineospora baliensis TaxID=547056 RepID=UPI001959D282|nr:hypothetical protein [Actinokineospora baliensis]MBM7775645.1 hypothetical protein [Actinokineospora baliensis]
MLNQRRALSALLAVVTAGTLVTTAQPAQAAPQPGLSAAYSARIAAVGSRWALVFTVTNADAPLVVAFSFGVSLPNGVTSPAAATSTCAATTVQVTSPGDYSISGALTGATPCTITVPVTSAAEGNYATCADDITGLTGLTAPLRCASIAFVAPYAS